MPYDTKDGEPWASRCRRCGLVRRYRPWFRNVGATYVYMMDAYRTDADSLWSELKKVPVCVPRKG